MLHALTTTTPTGPLSLLAHEDTLVASGFTADLDVLQQRLGGALRTADRRTANDLGPVTKALAAYLDGDIAALDLVDATQPGTAFQQHAWQVMRSIEPGRPVTYAAFAAMVGRPKAVRAAGSVCARNMLAPFVPCHRVVPTAGGVGNYGYGPPVKEWLLAHERRHSNG